MTINKISSMKFHLQFPLAYQWANHRTLYRNSMVEMIFIGSTYTYITWEIVMGLNDLHLRAMYTTHHTSPVLHKIGSFKYPPTSSLTALGAVVHITSPFIGNNFIIFETKFGTR